LQSVAADQASEKENMFYAWLGPTLLAAAAAAAIVTLCAAVH
jgi:hypothetical protein